MKAPDRTLDRALRWMATRPYGRFELGEKLQAIAGRETVEDILQELTRRGYLDDTKFALERALQRRQRKYWGDRRIEQELKRLGLDEHDIRKALDRTNQELDESGALQTVLQRWEQRWGPPEHHRALKKLYDHCLRLGYSSERVRPLLDPLFATLKRPTGRA